MPRKITTSKTPKQAAKPASAKPRKVAPERPAGGLKLLSGGNPQIPKGDGDVPVQA